MGRKSIYEKEVRQHLYLVEEWAKKGLSDEQIAANLGIATGTIYEWKKRYPEFDEAMKKGKGIADREVENALYMRAVGFEYEEEEESVDASGKKRKKIARKRLAPDVLAQIFWLKNRQPDRWRDKQELSGEMIFEIKKPEGLD